MIPMRRLVAVAGVVGLCVVAAGVGYLAHLALPDLGPGAAVAQDADDDAQPADDVVTTDAPAGDEAPPEEAVATAAVPATNAAPLVEAVAQMVRDEGAVIGRVAIGDRIVIVTRDEVNGLGAYERASIAAARINLALEEGAQPEDFQPVKRGDVWMVIARERMIVSVGPDEPAADGLNAQSVAESWATGIAMTLHGALGTKPGEEVPLPELSVEAQPVMAGGTEVGALMVSGQEVLRVTTPAPGLTPLERAQVVADRLRQAVNDGALPQDVVSEKLYGMSVVKVGPMLLITVSPDEARNAGMTPDQLAGDWAGKLSAAMSSYYGQAGKPMALQPKEWAPAEPYDDKWVPIVSILEGVKLGLARVNGPRTQVRTVQAVAQLETHWKDYVEIDVYVPISTKVPGKKLAVVKGCAVTGLGDIKL